MKKKLSILVIVFLLLVALAEGGLLYRAYAIPSADMKTARKINKIERTIKANYKGKIKQSELENYTYKGLVAGLGDPYSTYYTEKEFQELMESTDGVYSGVGIYMQQNAATGIITVVKTIKGSPSADIGLKKGDILLKVAGKSVSGQELSDVVTKIKGKEGTRVSLVFQRKGETGTKSYTITRKSIETPTVETKMLKDHIGYLSISEFDDVTIKQFRSGIARLKEQGMKSLIIDVRDNPGGLLTAVVDISDEILPQGKIVSVKDKNGNEKTYSSTDKNQLHVPLCLLVNGSSASASEILSGAVKDRNAGTLVGEKTYGKGIVQSFFDLRDGSYLKLTYASYYTPNGYNIHKKGIEPNVKIHENEKTSKDEQLEKAVQILEGKQAK